MMQLGMNIQIKQNNFKMKQIYKNIYQDENGNYVFANDNDTRYVVDQQSYILIYILEMLIKIEEKTKNELSSM